MAMLLAFSGKRLCSRQYFFFFLLAFSAFSTENICNEATGHAGLPEGGLFHSPTIIALNMMHTWDRQWLAHNAGSALRQRTQTRHMHTARVTYLCTWSAGPELRIFKLYRRFSSTLQVSPLFLRYTTSPHVGVHATVTCRLVTRTNTCFLVLSINQLTAFTLVMSPGVPFS